jgi:SagB-type dehydrogenase family enzyme
MSTKIRIFSLICLLLFLAIPQGGYAVTEINLPKAQINKNIYLDQAIAARRSIRSFKDKQLTLAQVAQLLWAADGVTEPTKGYRSAPSAGAIYPLTLLVVKEDGVWSYSPNKHSIKLVIAGDLRAKLAKAALGQSPIKNAPLSMVITADYQNITAKYGERGIIYSHIEAGHIAQNLALEAVALGLGSVPIGAFNDDQVENLLKLPIDEDVLYIIPVGYPK